METRLHHIELIQKEHGKILAEHDTLMRGDGNGKRGYGARLAILEYRDGKVRNMLHEWNDTKAQLKGARTTLIVVGVLITTLGGGLGIAILQTLSKLLNALP